MQIAEVELLGIAAPAPASGSAHIILVTEGIDWDLDGLRDDHSLESFLVSEGYNVDVRPDYWKLLTPDKITSLATLAGNGSIPGQGHQTTLHSSMRR